MPRNGSGTYTLPKPPFVPNTTISSADVNSDFSDIASALTGSIAANGETQITGPLKFTSGTVLLPGISFQSDDTTGIYYPGTSQLGFTANGVGAIILDTSRFGTGLDGGVLQYWNGAILVNVGEVRDYAGSSAPAGSLLCYGQAVSRTSYPELFFVIGTTYGSGDGTTTFNLPDLRGRLVYGKDNMGGSTAGRITTAGGGIDGVTLGAVGGVQNITILQTNLPSAVTLTTTIAAGQGSHTHTLTNASFIISAGGAGGPNTSAATSVNGPTPAVAANTLPAMTGTTPLGGSDTAIKTLSPGMVMNKIIFAGRV